MKYVHLLVLSALVAACQPAGREQKSPAAAPDSLAVAISNIRADLRAKPGDPELLVYLANALAQHGELDAADSIAALLSKDTANGFQAHYIRALIAMERKDTSGAILHISNVVALRQRSSEYEAVMLNAEMLLAQHRVKDALYYYNLAADIDSTSAEAAYGAGRCQALLGHKTAATARFQEAIRRNPAFSASYLGLGRQQEAAGDLKAALNFYNLAAKADPTDADAFYHRGRTLLRLGNRPAGLDDLTKALSFRSTFPEAAALLDSATKANNFQ